MARICPGCGERFFATDGHLKFCSRGCYLQWRERQAEDQSPKAIARRQKKRLKKRIERYIQCGISTEDFLEELGQLMELGLLDEARRPDMIKLVRKRVEWLADQYVDGRIPKEEVRAERLHLESLGLFKRQKD